MKFHTPLPFSKFPTLDVVALSVLLSEESISSLILVANELKRSPGAETISPVRQQDRSTSEELSLPGFRFHAQTISLVCSARVLWSNEQVSTAASSAAAAHFTSSRPVVASGKFVQTEIGITLERTGVVLGLPLDIAAGSLDASLRLLTLVTLSVSLT